MAGRGPGRPTERCRSGGGDQTLLGKHTSAQQRAAAHLGGQQAGEVVGAGEPPRLLRLQRGAQQAGPAAHVQVLHRRAAQRAPAAAAARVSNVKGGSVMRRANNAETARAGERAGTREEERRASPAATPSRFARLPPQRLVLVAPGTSPAAGSPTQAPHTLLHRLLAGDGRALRRLILHTAEKAIRLATRQLTVPGSEPGLAAPSGPPASPASCPSQPSPAHKSGHVVFACIPSLAEGQHAHAAWAFAHRQLASLPTKRPPACPSAAPDHHVTTPHPPCGPKCCRSGQRRRPARRPAGPPAPVHSQQEADGQQWARGPDLGRCAMAGWRRRGGHDEGQPADTQPPRVSVRACVRKSQMRVSPLQKKRHARQTRAPPC